MIVTEIFSDQSALSLNIIVEILRRVLQLLRLQLFVEQLHAALGISIKQCSLLTTDAQCPWLIRTKANSAVEAVAAYSAAKVVWNHVDVRPV